MFNVVTNRSRRMARMKRLYVSFTLILTSAQYAACVTRVSGVSGGAVFDPEVCAKMAVVLPHLARCLTSSLMVNMFRVVVGQLERDAPRCQSVTNNV